MATFRRRTPQPLVSVAAPIFGADDTHRGRTVRRRATGERRAAAARARRPYRSPLDLAWTRRPPVDRLLGSRRSLTCLAAQWLPVSMAWLWDRGATWPGDPRGSVACRRDCRADLPRCRRQASTCWRDRVASRKASRIRRWRARLRRVRGVADASPAPDVDVRSASAPGPHGPVPVRVYSPPGSTATERPAWSGCTAARSCSATSTWSRPTDRPGGLRAGRRGRGERRLPARRGRGHLPGAARRRGGCHPLGPRQRRGARRRRRRASRSAAPAPAATSPRARRCGYATTTAGCPASLLLAYTTTHAVVPPLSPSLARMMDEVPRLLRFLPEDRAWHHRATTWAGRRAGPTATRCRRTRWWTGCAPSSCSTPSTTTCALPAEAFAAKLALAGVDVRQVLVRGMLHGFLNLPASSSRSAAPST